MQQENLAVLKWLLLGGKAQSWATKVADFEAALCLLKYFLQKTNQCKLFSRPRIAVCAPVDMTPVEYRALHELIDSAGAKKTLVIEDSFVSAERSIPREYDLVVEIMLGEYLTD